MFGPLLNDLAQRVITLNKLEQRRSLAGYLSGMALSPGARVLDFGCGTGLFSPVFKKLGLRCSGFDVDPEVVAHAARLYPWAGFFCDWTDLRKAPKFDLILCNCCFHHIPGRELSGLLGDLRSLLSARGRLLLIDLIAAPERRNPLYRLFMKLEQGAFLRSPEEYAALVEPFFEIKNRELRRFHLLSLKSRFNPVFNDLLVLECRPREARKD